MKDQESMINTKLENSRAQLRRGTLELSVLSIISQGEIYPSDIIEKLKENKLIVVEGTLYPLLNRLKNENLLSYTWKESNAGPPRKYYLITENGVTFLEGLKETWIELTESVSSILS